MSRSIHITKRSFKGLSKKEIDEQSEDPSSDLKQWAKKSSLKSEVKKNRKEQRKNKTSLVDSRMKG